ncbi:MFS transporter [Paraburkholderia phenoliruptrix]|uniref:MFS transporter n=1 Tax=Paraburkholderia phenoliruptrix TaxID=252970 RepID=UPI001C6DF283|nr:aromatic acid/H+ symport family MFS transporter [Paraburkholderia phenoliruptrix]MBW9105078.1 aromatic acid/H+ symport family MFS transporter [Paraburkholderia phenoliruptrix]MBW9129724.1 aromatic acid/H+ symport family MFS transporter [Paraburkholderia ginsengiterrae]
MNGRTADIDTIIDTGKVSRFQTVILIMCFLVVLVDGFDTAVVGYIAPSLRGEWGLVANQLSPAFGAGLLGLMCGSFLVGPLADTYGRKKVLLLSVLVFGLATLASAASNSIGMFIALRFVTGIGLGGAMPTCITLSSEYSPARCRMLMVTLSSSGFAFGLALSGEIASHVIPVFGWRVLLLIGAIVPLLLLPLLAWLLPESVRFMVGRSRYRVALSAVVAKITGTTDWDEVTFVKGEPAANDRSPVSRLFVEGQAPRTLLLWGAFFGSMFVIYLLTSWLPSVLKDAGYGISTAARISTLLPVGGIFGGVTAAILMDRLNPHRVLFVMYFGAAIALAALGFLLADQVWASAAVFLVGVGVAGGQNGLNLLAAISYPTSARATGVSWAVASGRIGSIAGSMAGALMMTQLGQGQALFATIAGPALGGALALFVLGRLTERIRASDTRDIPATS